MRSRFHTCVRTDTGRVRERNEDSSLVLRWELHGQHPPSNVLIAAVADGMGGHANGHLASKLALGALAAAFTQGLARAPLEGVQALSDEQLVEMLREAVSAAAEQVNQAEQLGLSDLGTTICVALAVDSRAYIANIGDSRAYLIDAEGIQRITQDHSLVAKLVAQGELTEEEAAVHPQRHEIFRMLGFDRPAQPDIFCLQLQDEDRLLLCSDGLSNLVSDTELQSAFSVRSQIDVIADRLVELALERGAPDNVTLIALHVIAESLAAEQASDDRNAPVTDGDSAKPALVTT